MVSEGTGVYQDMSAWTEIRRRVLTNRASKRAICREYNIYWETPQKILQHEEPPGFRPYSLSCCIGTKQKPQKVP
jgi:hypothetical protein